MKEELKALGTVACTWFVVAAFGAGAVCFVVANVLDALQALSAL